MTIYKQDRFYDLKSTQFSTLYAIENINDFKTNQSINSTDHDR